MKIYMKCYEMHLFPRIGKNIIVMIGMGVMHMSSPIEKCLKIVGLADEITCTSSLKL